MSKTPIVGLYQILAVNMHKDVLKKSTLFRGMTDYQKLHNDLKFFPKIIAKLNFNISVILGKRLANLMERLEERPEDKD
ncbi:MAG: hypothetical protein ACUZ8O_17295 [Candidatus Anammoxibacter sp.]